MFTALLTLSSVHAELWAVIVAYVKWLQQLPASIRSWHESNSFPGQHFNKRTLKDASHAIAQPEGIYKGNSPSAFNKKVLNIKLQMTGSLSALSTTALVETSSFAHEVDAHSCETEADDADNARYEIVQELMTYCPSMDEVSDKQINSWLDDLHSVNWMEDSNLTDLSDESLKMQVRRVKNVTLFLLLYRKYQ
ncbi:unnamed protein product [Peronospora destructor]|uniref:Uncharacterized protein n=1 Tax=Peronospora destructor TaxID=86335 RepID=A0AAV0UNY5_9STRA|nr:unnamed protein product [Peronospora destructor]